MQNIRESANTADYTLNKKLILPVEVNRRKKVYMKLKDLIFERIEHYDPYNSRAKSNGMVSEWVARNSWGNAVAFGDTKAECLQDARKYVAIQNI